MSKPILLKALYSYRKTKVESLKNNEKNNRTNIIELRKRQIKEIDMEIEIIESLLSDILKLS